MARVVRSPRFQAGLETLYRDHPALRLFIEEELARAGDDPELSAPVAERSPDLPPQSAMRAARIAVAGLPTVSLLALYREETLTFFQVHLGPPPPIFEPGE